MRKRRRRREDERGGGDPPSRDVAAKSKRITMGLPLPSSPSTPQMPSAARAGTISAAYRHAVSTSDAEGQYLL